MLYSLVFGEGIVNDATSIVLLRAVQKIRQVGQREHALGQAKGEALSLASTPGLSVHLARLQWDSM